jgi:hypothetical protein
MKKTDKKQIAESIGIAAIVASLVFVGMQMQQDRRLARAELGSFALEFRASVDFGMSDPEAGRAWAKMLESPQDLSVAETIQVQGILRSARGMMLRECYLMAMEVFGECESLVGGVAREYFSNEYAQAWWRHVTNANSGGNLEAIEKVKGDL